MSASAATPLYATCTFLPAPAASNGAASQSLVTTSGRPANGASAAANGSSAAAQTRSLCFNANATQQVCMTVTPLSALTDDQINTQGIAGNILGTVAGTVAGLAGGSANTQQLAAQIAQAAGNIGGQLAGQYFGIPGL